MNAFLITLALISVVVLVSPAFTSAATNAGVKPGSFWYGFDLAFEKINLFFTFNSEGKARKALEYADERLAEAEAVAENSNTDAVKTAITNYENSIAFAAEKSKDVSEKEKAEALLTSIADNTSRHQEILADVLAKVPDGAKEAITKAIEASRRGREEAMRQVTELRGEVEQLKKEVAELKQNDDGNQAAEIEKLKQEINELKTKPTPTPVSIPTPTKSSTSQTSEATQVIKPAIPEIQTPVINKVSTKELDVSARQFYFGKYDGILLDKYPKHYENVSFFSFRLEARGDEPSIIDGFVVDALGTMNLAFIKKIKILSGADRLLAEADYMSGGTTLTLFANDAYSRRHRKIDQDETRDYIIAVDFFDDLHTEKGKSIGFSLKRVLTESNILGGLPIDSQLLMASTTKQ